MVLRLKNGLLAMNFTTKTVKVQPETAKSSQFYSLNSQITAKNSQNRVILQLKQSKNSQKKLKPGDFTALTVRLQPETAKTRQLYIFNSQIRVKNSSNPLILQLKQSNYI